MSTTTNPSEVINTIITRAWEDESYKRELIADPSSKFMEITDPKAVLPPNAKLRVNDQTDPTVYYINIPPQEWVMLGVSGMEDNLELSDEQLEAVAGGDIFGGILLGLLAGAAAYGLGYAAGEIF